jgi:hypothetical protein
LTGARRRHRYLVRGVGAVFDLRLFARRVGVSRFIATSTLPIYAPRADGVAVRSDSIMMMNPYRRPMPAEQQQQQQLQQSHHGLATSIGSRSGATTTAVGVLHPSVAAVVGGPTSPYEMCSVDGPTHRHTVAADPLSSAEYIAVTGAENWNDGRNGGGGGQPTLYCSSAVYVDDKQQFCCRSSPTAEQRCHAGGAIDGRMTASSLSVPLYGNSNTPGETFTSSPTGTTVSSVTMESASTIAAAISSSLHRSATSVTSMSVPEAHDKLLVHRQNGTTTTTTTSGVRQHELPHRQQMFSFSPVAADDTSIDDLRQPLQQQPLPGVTPNHRASIVAGCGSEYRLQQMTIQDGSCVATPSRQQQQHHHHAGIAYFDDEMPIYGSHQNHVRAASAAVAPPPYDCGVLGTYRTPCAGNSDSTTVTPDIRFCGRDSVSSVNNGRFYAYGGVPAALSSASPTASCCMTSSSTSVASAQGFRADSTCRGSRATLVTAPPAPVVTATYKWMTVKRGPPRTTIGQWESMILYNL